MSERSPVDASAAYTAWSGLAPPWQAAIEAAWSSYRSGGIAVGAVLTDGAGRIRSTGRNQRFAGPGGALLAHAEMAALAALPPDKDRARDSVLYTTLSPCPMCLGAIVVARVGRVCCGAVDPTWAGIEALPTLNDEVRRRWPLLESPLDGNIGAWLAGAAAWNAGGALLRALRRSAPHQAALAQAVHQRYQRLPALPERAADALAEAWVLLPESHP